jgi:4'-phosphopantetheinyl transferase
VNRTGGPASDSPTGTDPFAFRPGGEVHVWHAELPHLLAAGDRLARCLDEEERERAARLLDGSAAARFRATRGVLRELLGGYLGLEPAALPLRTEEHGKPCLPAPAPLHFNVSHTSDRVFLAFSPVTRVGIDVERIRPLGHAERIARRAFSADELATWLALDEHQRLAGFFERWTRMEARAKLLGHGVWRLLAEEGASTRTATLHRLNAPEGHVAMLALEGSGLGVIERAFRP